MLGFIKAKNGEEIEIVDAKAREDNKIIYPEFTPSSVVNPSNMGLVFRLQGKILSIKGWARVNTTIETGGFCTVYTVPSQYLPKNEYETYSIAYCYNNKATMLCYISNNELRLFQPSISVPANGTIAVSMEYEIK